MKAKKPAETAREQRTLNCGHKDLEDLAVKAILACFFVGGGGGSLLCTKRRKERKDGILLQYFWKCSGRKRISQLSTPRSLLYSCECECEF